MAKDFWDRFEIFTKFLGTVVLVAFPIVIKHGADNIAQSLERGKLVQSLIEDLTQSNTQARRDIALVALDGAVPIQKECALLWLWNCEAIPESDQVIEVALILLNDLARGSSQSGQPLLESDTAKRIITKRASVEFYDEKFKEISKNARPRSTVNPKEETPSQADLQRQAQSSEVIRNIQPPPKVEPTEDLSGIRLVYIQYRSDRLKAERLQEYLQDQGILAPGIEQVQGIQRNDIRYSGIVDKLVAESLENHLEKNQDLEFESLIDLSNSGYKVPSGQFEIWLKD